MSDQYVGEIRIFAGVGQPPVNWVVCDGRALSIQEYQELYSLIGVTYGGDGHTTFNLPNLQGRLGVSQGQGTGLSNRAIGQAFGTNTVTVTTAQMPAHSHTLLAIPATAGTDSPNGTYLAQPFVADTKFYAPADATHVKGAMAPAISTEGGGTAHGNLMPFMCLTYIIATHGNYPNLQ